MRDFITCLEFLSRIRFSGRSDWREDDFSRSVPYFTFAGLMMGMLMSGANFLMLAAETPSVLRSAGLILAEILIIGSLMYDGYMDTSDGIFSARERERMLEIMKDSHVGANAVIALFVLVLLKVACYMVIEGNVLTYALVCAYTTTRTFMVSYIVHHDYARKTGIGHMFKQYSKPVYTYVAFFSCAIILSCFGLPYVYAAGITFLLCQAVAFYISRQLGGLTGDTYGFLTECGMVVYLLSLFYILKF